MHYFKSFDFSWFENLFGLLIGFYVQPFIFSLRGELLLPSLRRTKKIAKISVLSEALLFIVIGFVGYSVLGDNFTTDVFVLRTPYPGKNWFSEKIFQSLIGIFFILNTLGLAMYNPSIRNYIQEFIDLETDRKKYVFYSLLPFGVICLGAWLFPKITDVLNCFGYTVYNFNGYIIPLLLNLYTLKR